MQFTKGNKIGRGRTKGAKNKTTKKAKDIFVDTMNEQMPKINEALEQVRQDNPKDYLNIVAKLFAYFLPTKVNVGQEEDIVWRVKVVRGKDN